MLEKEKLRIIKIKRYIYSGECDAGCVVTELPPRLIRDIYNTPTLLIHEYAHVYELAIPSERVAYCNR